jgi:hypothetical protein
MRESRTKRRLYQCEQENPDGGSLQHTPSATCEASLSGSPTPNQNQLQETTVKRIAFALTAALLACSTLFAQQKPTLSYTFQDVTYPKDTFVQLLSINNNDLIAGYHGASVNKGFTLTLPSTFTAENFPQSTMTQVIGINNNTNVATGGFYVDKKNVTHGFLHRTGKWTTVDFPGTTFNQILGLNDIGQAAGYYQDAAGNFHPYIYAKTGGVFSEIFLPGTSSAQATGINNSQTIVGFYLDANQVSHGWELNGGTYTALNFPGSTSTQALGINNLNQIVGSYTDSANAMHGFVYSGGTWTSVDDPSGIGITLINGINDTGKIVGFIVISPTVNTGFVGTELE